MRLLEADIVARPAPSGRRGAWWPLVRALVGGEPTWLVIDTGASETLLSLYLIQKLGLALEPAEPGVDHAGAEVETWTCADPVDLTIGGLTIRLEVAAVIGGAASFQREGIGGVVSPQTLIADSTLILDLPDRRMSIFSGGSAPTQGIAPGLALVTLRATEMAGDLKQMVTIAGAFDGSVAGALILNTGAWEAEAGPSPSADPRASVSTGRGLSGAEVLGAVGRGVFRVAEVEITAPEVVLRPQTEGVEGQIGLEILQHTRLEAHLASGAVRWWVPAEWLGRRSGG